jgi:hypothetical protein
MQNLILTDRQKKILTGKICPYCGKGTKLIRGGISYTWQCVPCEALITCHKGSDLAMGWVAKVDVRKLRRLAHIAISEYQERRCKSTKEVYYLLSKCLDIHPDLCHFGMFGPEVCKKAIDLVTGL